jgi:hypothetical protein
MYKIYCEEIGESEKTKFNTNPLLGFKGYLLYVPTEEENLMIKILPKKIEKKCLECRRPYMVTAEEKWRTYCPACFVLLNGEIVECSGCEKKIPIYSDQKDEHNFCQECYKIKNGQSKVCLNCFKTFYYIEKNLENVPENCYECFLKLNGVKQKCVDCKENFYVKKESKKWKKRCYDCWLDSKTKLKKTKQGVIKK